MRHWENSQEVTGSEKAKEGTHSPADDLRYYILQRADISKVSSLLNLVVQIQLLTRSTKRL